MASKRISADNTRKDALLTQEVACMNCAARFVLAYPLSIASKFLQRLSHNTLRCELCNGVLQRIEQPITPSLILRN